MSEILITKNSMDYSIRKSAKLGVYLIRGRFDLKNVMFWPLGITGSLAKVLTVVHENFVTNYVGNPDHQKVHWLEHTKIGKIWGYHALGHIWPSKWDVLAAWSNWIHTWGLNGRPRKFLTIIMSELQITKKSVDYSTRESAKWGVYLLWGTFDLCNRKFLSCGLTGTRAKVLTDVHRNFWKKWGQNSRSPKSPWTIAHDNRQNSGFT